MAGLSLIYAALPQAAGTHRCMQNAKCSFLCIALPCHGSSTLDTGTNPTASPSQDVPAHAWTTLYSLASPVLSNDQSQEVICWLLGRKMLGFVPPRPAPVSSTDHFCLQRKPLAQTHGCTHTYFPKAPAPREEHPRATPASSYAAVEAAVMCPQGRSQKRTQMWGIREERNSCIHLQLPHKASGLLHLAHRL